MLVFPFEGEGKQEEGDKRDGSIKHGAFQPKFAASDQRIALCLRLKEGG